MFDVLIRKGRKGAYSWEVVESVQTSEEAVLIVTMLMVEAGGRAFYTWAKQGASNV